MVKKKDDALIIQFKVLSMLNHPVFYLIFLFYNFFFSFKTELETRVKLRGHDPLRKGKELGE